MTRTTLPPGSGPPGAKSPGTLGTATSAQTPEDRMRDFVLEHCGVRVPPDQNYFFDTRLRRIIQQAGLADLRALLDAISLPTIEALELRARVVDALMTHETSFFRNPEVFQRLRNQLVPDLLKPMNAASELRIWSAAASTGQEAVSLSIMLQEMGIRRPYAILGTDIGVGTLARAGTGVYSVLETNRGLGAPQIVRWFEREGAGFRVRPEVRDPISYRVHNLLDPMIGAVPFQLVMLRNVLVYFDEPSRKKAFENVARVITPGAVVVLGTGEQLLNIPEHLYTRHVEGNVAWLRRK